MTDDSGTTKKAKRREKDIPIPGWVRLQELSRKGTPKAALTNQGKPAGPGRPRNPFKRHQVHITMTESEESALNEAVTILQTSMKGIHRGLLAGFLANWLLDHLKNSDASQLETLEDLIIFLENSKEVVFPHKDETK